jgi:hypothetical protein
MKFTFILRHIYFARLCNDKNSYLVLFYTDFVCKPKPMKLSFKWLWYNVVVILCLFNIAPEGSIRSIFLVTTCSAAAKLVWQTWKLFRLPLSVLWGITLIYFKNKLDQNCVFDLFSFSFFRDPVFIFLKIYVQQGIIFIVYFKEYSKIERCKIVDVSIMLPFKIYISSRYKASVK